MKCSHSGAANGKVTGLVHLSVLLIPCLSSIFRLAPRGYSPPGFTRARSFISSENCFAGFQSLAAGCDKTQYQEHLCFLSAIFSGYK